MDPQRLHGFGNVMGADDRSAIARSHEMSRERAADPLVRFRGDHLIDEALS